MNFNADYQSNQDRLHGINAASARDLESWSNAQIIRVLCEVFFVVMAVGLGYIQGLKTPVNTVDTTNTAAYTESQQQAQQKNNYAENDQHQKKGSGKKASRKMG